MRIYILAMALFVSLTTCYGDPGKHVIIGPDSPKKKNLSVNIVRDKPGHVNVIFTISDPNQDLWIAVPSSTFVPPENLDFRSLIWKYVETKERPYNCTFSHNDLRTDKKVTVGFNDAAFSSHYIIIDYPREADDKGGNYYTIDLPAFYKAQQGKNKQ